MYLSVRVAIFKFHSSVVCVSLDLCGFKRQGHTLLAHIYFYTSLQSLYVWKMNPPQAHALYREKKCVKFQKAKCDMERYDYGGILILCENVEKGWMF